MTYSEEEHIDYIIDRFNFERVRKFMEINDWKWGPRIPTLSELKSTSLKLLMNVKDGERGDFSSTGGFIATNCGDFLRLDFSMEGMESIYLNLTDNYNKDKKRKERKSKLEVIDGIST